MKELTPKKQEELKKLESQLARIEEAEKKGLKVGQFESFLRGVGDDLSMEFADELYGKAESLLTDKPYKEARDEQRLQSQIAKDQNPGAYYGGMTLGMVAQVLATGGLSMLGKMIGRKGAQQAAKEVSKKTLAKQTGKGMATGATAGGVGGIGRSEKEKASEILEDAKTDAVAGAVLGGGIAGAGHAISKTKEALGKGLKYTKEKGIEAVTSLSPEHQNFIKNNLPLIRKKQDIDSFTDKITGKMKELSIKNKAAKEKADQLLLNSKDSNEGAIPKQRLNQVIKDIKSTIGISTQEGNKATARKHKAALGYLNTLSKDLGKLDSNLSQKEVKKFIKGLDDDANWNNPAFDSRNDAIKKVRRGIDTILKEENPGYKEAMIPVARMTSTLDKMQKNFKINREFMDGEDFYEASERTYTQMNKLGNKPRRSAQLRKSMTDLGKESNEDLANEARAAYINQVTEGGVAQGSRKVDLGQGIGGIKGAVAGAFLDVAGRKAAKEGLYATDQLSKNLSNASFVKKLGQFKEPLMRAVQKGSKELAVTHYILSQDPEYLKKIMDNEE